MYNTKTISSMTDTDINELDKKFDMLSNVSKSKVLSPDEEHDVKATLASFQYTLLKSSNGNLVSPELKPLVKMFSDTKYDISKLPVKYRDNLKKTYNELSVALKQEPDALKNSSAKLYCEIYDTLSGKNFKTLIDKVQNSKAFKNMKTGLSREEFFDIDKLDNLIADTKNGVSTQYSEEGVLDAAKLFFGRLAVTTNAVNTLVWVLIIITVLAIIMFVTLVIIFCSYNDQVVKLLKETNELNKKMARNDRCTLAAKNMEESISPATKKCLFKPAHIGTKYVNDLSKNSASAVEKTVNFIDSHYNSKESYDQSTEALPEALAVAGIAAGVYFVLIPLIRAAVYYIHHLKLQLSNFFEEQAEVLSVNMDELTEKKDDPNTPKSEKERIGKVIERQQTWYKNLISLSSVFYKKQAEANYDTHDDIVDDDKQDFDAAVEEDSSKPVADGDTSSSSTAETARPSISKTTKPTIVF